MGQKVNPIGFRVGITKDHNTKWFADKRQYTNYLLEDQKIYRFLDKLVRKYQIGQVEIMRTQINDVMVVIHSSRPAAILGQGGENLQKLNNEIKKFIKNRDIKLTLSVVPIDAPELNARLVAEEIAIKLEKRGSFRAAQKYVIRQAFRRGAKGIKTSVSGRLNGVDMARTEGYTEGEMKLHTLRQDVDFAMARANTTFGVIGVKVWISKGEILDGGRKNAAAKTN